MARRSESTRTALVTALALQCVWGTTYMFFGILDKDVITARIVQVQFDECLHRSVWYVNLRDAYIHSRRLREIHRHVETNNTRA